MDLYLDGVLQFQQEQDLLSYEDKPPTQTFLLSLSGVPPHLRSWGGTRDKPKNACEGSYTRMGKVIKSELLVLLKCPWRCLFEQQITNWFLLDEPNKELNYLINNLKSRSRDHKKKQ